MKLFACICVALVVSPLVVFSQVVAPHPGVPLPQSYFDRIAEDKTAFRFQKAWIERTRRAKESRQRFLAERDAGASIESLPMTDRQRMMVAGNYYVPIMMGKYANTGADPYPVSNMQDKLFENNPSGTMSEFYTEMSYGNLIVAGTVYEWVTMPQNDTYYEGGTNGLSPPAKTGEFILTLLQANDPMVDFGLYDNDGPDGLPNSGDDDGFVDFITVVQPEIGGECGNSNIWSHHWVVGAWTAFGRVGNTLGPPWQTNDPSANGGNIKIWDYALMPALGSGSGCGAGITEIGRLCHELGHAFGLPALYDTNGGGQGIGHWGLMSSGNWNTPSNPAHMTAYSKKELGWIVPTAVGHTSETYSVPSVELNPVAYQLNMFEEKFARKNFTPIAGSYSLHCGLTTTEALARKWIGGSGSGNGWDESIRRDFSYDGSNPVTLGYDYSYDTEAGYDYAYVKIDVSGTVTTLATYSGNGSGHEVIDLTPFLSGSGASTYQLIFQFISDDLWSDEDGQYYTGFGGPYKIDNVSVSGGGENYFTDFEEHEAGWYYDFDESPPKEYFLVENRNKLGAQFDQFLHGEGLLILHVEENVVRSSLVNSGGSSNQVTRGLTVEEADGLKELLFTGDRGDAGDIFPGSTNNTVFDNSSNPNSKSHNALMTTVAVENIGPPGASMTATMRAGRMSPTISSITPNTGESGQTISITDLSGSNIVHGATFLLRDLNMTEYPAVDVGWIGKAKLTGHMDLSGVPEGSHDVVVRNPDGQEAVLPAAFLVTGSVVPAIESILDVENDQGGSVSLTWTRSARDAAVPSPVIGYELYRRIDPNLVAVKAPVRPDPRITSLPSWSVVMTVPATMNDVYTAVLPTLKDSTIITGMYFSAFFVRATTAEPDTFFDSPPDSGYSVDNLAPTTPQGFNVAYNATGGNLLSWHPSTELDYWYVKIHRAITPDFTPEWGNLVYGGTDDTLWVDPVNEAWKYHYKIAAVDSSGNTSTAVPPATVTAVDQGMIPAKLVLHGAIPNPFNPRTVIRFSLPAEGLAEISIYDVGGRLVRALIRENKAAGSHSTEWDGSDDRGTTVTSGVYFVRLRFADAVKTEKIVLLK